MQSEVLLTLYIRHNLGSHLGDFFVSENFIWKVLVSSFRKLRSGPITSWEIDGETLETVSDFIFLASKITVDGDCNHEIKRRFLLERKVMTKLDSILEKEMATHYSVLAWRIPGTGEPGELLAMGSHRVGHD